jgi:predicted TIM-barrel fold metal-dependent hydrolase
MDANGRYTIISAECHAGASHATYREYLDPDLREDFDAWRGGYKNPFRDLQGDTRTRNWDNERRVRELEEDGIVGEIVFPNTVPPFFPTGALIARPPTPEQYPKRLAGIRAHNRWLADWCAEYGDRRAGIAQIFLNDVDDAIAEAEFALEHNLRGGILVPGVPPDEKHIRPLYDPEYDRLWRFCEENEIPVNHHSGGGSPSYGDYPASGLLFLVETPFYSQRALVHLLLSGVFERFPNMKLVLTEQGCAWIPPLLERLDVIHNEIVAKGRVGELGFKSGPTLSLRPSEYFQRNVWVGLSFPNPTESAAIRTIGVDKIMWGSDYPHHEGTFPYTREALRQSFAGWDHGDVAKLLSGNAADVYNFDLEALGRVAAKVGPTVEEVDRPLDKVPAGSGSGAFRT